MSTTFSWIRIWSVFPRFIIQASNLIFRALKDINNLVGNHSPIQIPQALVKLVSYILFIHIIALVFAVAACIVGLVPLCGGLFRSFISGAAGGICLFLFIFDLVVFFGAKARINSVGSAQTGSAIWFTFAAWLILWGSALIACCM